MFPTTGQRGDIVLRRVRLDGRFSDVRVGDPGRSFSVRDIVSVEQGPKGSVIFGVRGTHDDSGRSGRQ